MSTFWGTDQRSLVQSLQNECFPVEGILSVGDKRARLAVTTYLIQSGKILFPRKGAERIIEQITGFGREKHDDLCDAFTLLIRRIMENNKPGAKLTINWY